MVATAAPPARGGDETSLGETPGAAQYNSTLLTAMRDYFGDDGREMQDYMMRPREAGGKKRPLFRLLIAGVDASLARALHASQRWRALYYLCPPPPPGPEGEAEAERRRVVVLDEDDVWEPEFMENHQLNEYVRAADLPDDDADKWAQRAGEPDAPLDADAVVAFARWAAVDAVFLVDAAPGLDAERLQPALAEFGVTVYGADVSRAVVDGSLDVAECLSSLAGAAEEGGGSVGETLLE